MILIDKIKITVTNKNVGYYKKLGYDIKSGQIIDVNISDLPKTSKLIIKVSCPECHKEYNISYDS